MKIFACMATLGLALSLSAQTPTTHPQAAPPPVKEVIAGDMPSDPGPLATDLSVSPTSVSIRTAMTKVADWQLSRVKDQSSREWTYSALYVGFLSASDTLHDPRYRDYVEHVAEQNRWTLGSRTLHADDQAIGQVYLWLYKQNPAPEKLQPLRRQFDAVMQTPDDADLPMWWWCDALFMAPPIWSELASITHDSRYLNYMDRQWHDADKLLWSQENGLFFRDKSYFNRQEKNGSRIFWSRGNGWTMAGLARVLDTLPPHDPRRTFYVKRLQRMSEVVAAMQGSDGLWKPGLLDPEAYPSPEVSGSSFFLYTIAWGLNHHLLSEEKYAPVLTRGWAGLVRHIYADGRLGSIQPVGAGPSSYTPGSSYVFGVGAFLLAGSEIDRWATAHPVSKP